MSRDARPSLADNGLSGEGCLRAGVAPQGRGARGYRDVLAPSRWQTTFRRELGPLDSEQSFADAGSRAGGRA